MISLDRLTALHYQSDNNGHTPTQIKLLTKMGKPLNSENGALINITLGELREMLATYEEHYNAEDQ